MTEQERRRAEEEYRRAQEEFLRFIYSTNGFNTNSRRQNPYQQQYTYTHHQSGPGGSQSQYSSNSNNYNNFHNFMEKEYERAKYRLYFQAFMFLLSFYFIIKLFSSPSPQEQSRAHQDFYNKMNGFNDYKQVERKMSQRDNREYVLVKDMKTGKISEMTREQFDMLRNKEKWAAEKKRKHDQKNRELMEDLRKKQRARMMREKREREMQVIREREKRMNVIERALAEEQRRVKE
jgi:hypothetical protein